MNCGKDKFKDNESLVPVKILAEINKKWVKLDLTQNSLGGKDDLSKLGIHFKIVMHTWMENTKI